MAEILISIAKVLVEIPLMWTGEILLYLGSFGKRKPRWNLYADESPSSFVIFTEISLWIGAAFWLGVGAVIYLITL